MYLLYDNEILNATITPSTESTDYRFTVNLLDDRLSRVGRTTSSTSQYIRFAFPANISPTKILIQDHNLTDMAVVRLSMYTESTYSGAVYDQVLTYRENYMYDVIPASTYIEDSYYLVDESGNRIVAEIFSYLPFYIVDESSNNLIDENSNLIFGRHYTGSGTYDYIYGNINQTGYRYFELSITNATNPDGYIEISKIFLGCELAVYMDTGIALPSKTSAQTYKSVSGQLYANRLLNYKAAKFVLSNIDQTDRTLINDFWNYVDICNPFWMIIWEDDLTVEPPLYCSLTEELQWGKMPTEGNLWTVGMTVEEVF